MTTIQELIDYLKDEPDKSLSVKIPDENGILRTPCIGASGVADNFTTGEIVYVLSPCMCHDDIEIVEDVVADDMEINPN